jgi:hypothetical protein
MTKRKGPFCGAKLHQRQGTCTQPAGWGTDHVGAGACKLHGGCMPNHQAGALRVLAEDQARGELARLGVPATAVTNPLELLATLCGEARAWQQVCRAQLDEVGSVTTITAAGFEQLRAEISLWERAIDRVERFATSMARLGLDDRIVALNERISQAQGVVIYEATVAALTELGLDPDDERVRATMARHLHAAAADD